MDKYNAQPKVCLVHTPCQEVRDDRLEPPLGLLYLAANIKKHGYPVEIVDLSAQVQSRLDGLVPDDFQVYGFSTYSVNYQFTLQLANVVRKRNPNALFIAGGPHATALPVNVSSDGFDVVITGEGEILVLEVLQNLKQGIRSASIISGQSPIDLDELPFPDYDQVALSTYSREIGGHRCVSILTSRGCPYPCSFCNSNIMGAGKAIRYRSPENVIAEIRLIKKRFWIRHFRFQDDIFTISIKRIRELAPYLASEDIVYRCFARVNTFTQEMAETLRDSGCLHVSFGIESGSPKLLAKHAMHKNQTPKQIQQALENAGRAGIRTRVFLLVGFPGETDETIKETIMLMKQCPWDEFSVYPLIAYPGTPLHNRPTDYGITYIDRDYSNYLQIGKNYKAGFTIRTKDFDEHKVREWRDHVISELLSNGRTWAGNAKGFQ